MDRRIILVARCGISRFPQVDRARRQISAAGIPILKTVLNGVRSVRYHGVGDYYYEDYDAEGRGRRRADDLRRKIQHVTLRPSRSEIDPRAAGCMHRDVSPPGRAGGHALPSPQEAKRVSRLPTRRCGIVRDERSVPK